MSNVFVLAQDQTATGVSKQYAEYGQKGIYNKTFQSVGSVTAATGSATIAVEGSNDGLNWVSLGNVNLTLGTTVTTQSLTYTFPWRYYRSNVSALTGTGAKVSVFMAL